MRGLALLNIHAKLLPERHLRSPRTWLAISARNLSWQPVFRFDSDDLLAEAPNLRKQCEDLDWGKQANDLRALAARSLQTKDGAAGDQQSQDSSDNLRKDNRDQGPWFTAFVAIVAAQLQCGLTFSAIAQETSESAEVASRAPGWLVPAVLTFPVLSYGLFNLYRDQVNPYAKVTDWMFGMVALVIVVNLVLIVTLGVRLY